jgi:hypothetical protein
MERYNGATPPSTPQPLMSRSRDDGGAAPF